MIPISFPIAYLRNSVNPPTYVYLITLFLPEDDTSDVIPRHTMLRHAYHVSATRNFRLTPTHPPTPLRDFRPLIPPSSYASPLLCAPHHALARRARVRRRSTQVRQPSACRLPFSSLRTLIPYSLVSRETREDNSRPQPGESPTCARADSLAPLARLRFAPPPALAHGREDHGDCRAAIRRPPTSYSCVSRETTEHRPLPLTRPVLLSCPRSERSLSVHSPRPHPHYPPNSK